MSRIQMDIVTEKSIDECRAFIDNSIVTRPEAQMLLSECSWTDNVLHAGGSLGQGTISLLPGIIRIDIELSMFGAAAKGRIEEVLSEQFKRLD